MKKTLIIGSSIFALPALAFAAAGEADLSYFEQFVDSIGNIVAALIPILIGIGLLVFFWGLIQYIRKPEAAEGRKIMIAGLVALFIMVSVWGIVKLAQNVLNVEGDADVNAPELPN